MQITKKVTEDLWKTLSSREEERNMHRLVFSDVLVSATELNRRPGYVLDQASSHPITITRGGRSYVLLQREDAHRMTQLGQEASLAIAVMHAVFRLRVSRDLPERDRLAWISVFDDEDLTDLVNEVKSVYEELEAGAQTDDSVSAVVHEWKESALAILSEEHKQAYEASRTLAERQRVPLTNPSEIGTGENGEDH